MRERTSRSPLRVLIADACTDITETLAALASLWRDPQTEWHGMVLE